MVSPARSDQARSLQTKFPVAVASILTSGRLSNIPPPPSQSLSFHLLMLAARCEKQTSSLPSSVSFTRSPDTHNRHHESPPERPARVSGPRYDNDPTPLVKSYCGRISAGLVRASSALDHIFRATRRVGDRHIHTKQIKWALSPLSVWHRANGSHQLFSLGANCRIYSA